MTVGQFCNREVVYIDRRASITEAAQRMRAHHVGDLVVTEERNGHRFPVGIVTDRDLVLEILAEDVRRAEVTVGDVMSRELVTARETDSLLDTVKIMRARGVRRVPVTAIGGELAGILSVDDLIDLFAEQLTDLARLITREQDREARERRLQFE